MNKSKGIYAIIMAMSISILLGVVFFGFPKYRIYSATHIGKAELARAEGNRKIMVAQAEAERDAAKLRAEAIAIVGKAAKEFPEYRTQEFIGAFADAMQNGRIDKIIYIPTEANIPIIERP